MSRGGSIGFADGSSAALRALFVWSSAPTAHSGSSADNADNAERTQRCRSSDRRPTESAALRNGTSRENTKLSAAALRFRGSFRFVARRAGPVGRSSSLCLGVFYVRPLSSFLYAPFVLIEHLESSWPRFSAVLTRVWLMSGCVTQRSSSIRTRAARAAPRDCAVSIQTRVRQHLLGGGRVERPNTVPCCRARERVDRAYATFTIAPAGTTPVVTYRHSAITSLRATATIPIRRARLPFPKLV